MCVDGCCSWTLCVWEGVGLCVIVGAYDCVCVCVLPRPKLCTVLNQLCCDDIIVEAIAAISVCVMDFMRVCKFSIFQINAKPVLSIKCITLHKREYIYSNNTNNKRITIKTYRIFICTFRVSKFHQYFTYQEICHLSKLYLPSRVTSCRKDQPALR